MIKRNKAEGESSAVKQSVKPYNWEVVIKFVDRSPEQKHYFHTEIAMAVFVDDLDLDQLSSIFIYNLGVNRGN